MKDRIMIERISLENQKEFSNKLKEYASDLKKATKDLREEREPGSPREDVLLLYIGKIAQCIEALSVAYLDKPL